MAEWVEACAVDDVDEEDLTRLYREAASTEPGQGTGPTRETPTPQGITRHHGRRRRFRQRLT
jgi:hypothetical protein